MYEPYTWQTGEVITAEKLNHIEQGIDKCVMVVKVNKTESESEVRLSLDATWQTIYNAAKSGRVVVTITEDLLSLTSEYAEIYTSVAYTIGKNESGFYVSAGENTYYATSADGYPDFTTPIE